MSDQDSDDADELARRDQDVPASYEYAEFRVAPTPPVHELRELADISADLPDRTMRMAEVQQRHRVRLERRQAMLPFLSTTIGQVAGLVVAVLGFALTAYLAHIHEPVVAGILGTIDLLGIVATFVSGAPQGQRKDDDGS